MLPPQHPRTWTDSWRSTTTPSVVLDAIDAAGIKDDTIVVAHVPAVFRLEAATA